MDKDTALRIFYQKNGLDPVRAADPSDGCYDPQIAALPQRVEQWLTAIRPGDQDAFLTLLSEYRYLSRPQCQARYQQIVSMLHSRLSDLQLDLSAVLFVTVEAGGACASGGDNVRSDLRCGAFRVLTKGQIIAVQSKLTEEDIAPYQAVLFLDDVIGSGKTMWRSICRLRTDFPDWFCRQRVFCASIAPRSRGVTHINKNCKKAGISVAWLYDDAWVQSPAFAINSEEYRHLEDYEKLIGTCLTESDKSFFMGFEKNRLILSFYYNTPNNTLSTFWRAGVDMEPPFYRDGDQISRPTLENLKRRKAQACAQAYRLGMDRRSGKHGST